MRPLIIACLAVCGSGCFLSPLPDVRTPADHARDVLLTCRDFPEEAIAPYLSREAVESVEPAKSTLPSPSGHDTRVRGGGRG